MRGTPGSPSSQPRDDTYSDTYLRASSALRACASLRPAARRGCAAGLAARMCRFVRDPLLRGRDLAGVSHWRRGVGTRGPRRGKERGDEGSQAGDWEWGPARGKERGGGGVLGGGRGAGTRRLPGGKEHGGVGSSAGDRAERRGPVLGEGTWGPA